MIGEGSNDVLRVYIAAVGLRTLPHVVLRLKIRCGGLTP
jgi:hypothetical protein